ncbi:hypothetical protein ACN38_g6149, partial [Penicillium nordicum]
DPKVLGCKYLCNMTVSFLRHYKESSRFNITTTRSKLLPSNIPPCY